MTLEEYKKMRRRQYAAEHHSPRWRTISYLVFGLIFSPLLLILYLVFGILLVPVGAGIGSMELGAALAFLAATACWIAFLRWWCMGVEEGDRHLWDVWSTREWQALREEQRKHEDSERQKELLRRATSIDQELREHNRVLERLEKSPFIRSR